MWFTPPLSFVVGMNSRAITLATLTMLVQTDRANLGGELTCGTQYLPFSQGNMKVAYDPDRILMKVASKVYGVFVAPLCCWTDRESRDK
jgi:hypothetical protein